MARDKAYRKAEKKIEQARRSGATELDLSAKYDAPDNKKLIELPESIGQLTQLRSLNIYGNKLTVIPEWLGNLSNLILLEVSANKLKKLPVSIGELKLLKTLKCQSSPLRNLPDSLGKLSNLNELVLGGSTGTPIQKIPSFIRQLKKLTRLIVNKCDLEVLPEWVGELSELKNLNLNDNHISDLPPSLAQLEHLKELELRNNPLNPELAAAYKEGLEAVKTYLRAKAADQITLNEAKLILVGEGEVGKTCLMDALQGTPWQEHDTTHGIEIRAVQAVDPESGAEITLNGWDFGGQRVYRPTHQLFFSSPAVYLVVWKPREGPQQGFVKEWIKLIKHREPEAQILVVATHGGPQQRQPDIDRQGLWDLFGRETVLDFFHVESKPDEDGQRRGIDKLKQAIAAVAAGLPEMGREVPKSFQDVRDALGETGAAYLPLARVFAICRKHKMDDELARLFVTISHRLGHFIHYEHDPALRDIIVLKPSWLATAISFVLDDKVTRKENHGVVSFARLSQLWNAPEREAEFRYTPDLHPLFLRLMERFDLSYKVALPTEASDAIGFWHQFRGMLSKAVGRKDALTNLHYTSLIAQLVPDTRPETQLAAAWPPDVESGDIQQAQICRIVDAQNGQSATAEGLFYQLNRAATQTLAGARALR